MKVCIAEKPSVAREIAKVLGANTRRDGYFEGNGYAVTYTFGHLCTLKEPIDYKAYWKRWDLNNLPMLPERFDIKVVSNSGVQKQFEIIKSLFQKASVVINCGDAGQEGELIQRWVAQKASYQGEEKRLWISSLTEEAIKEGFEKLRPSSEFDSLFYAGYSRAIGDWLLGINATRLFSLKYGSKGRVLSIGRVQTPTLAMVVDRYKSVMDFVPKPYWELQTQYKNTVFKCEKGRFLKESKGVEFAEKVKKFRFEVVEIEKRSGNEYSPKLFDLTSLQVYANTKFGFTAEETLNIAQKLYEQKLITYPRVDTNFLPSDIFPKVKKILSGLKQFQNLTQILLAKKLKKSSRVFNDKKVTDHHAIIPTGLENSLPENHQKVYDIICRRFIAAFYEDCKVAHTTIKGKTDDVIFKTSGKQIVDPGWRILFSKTKDEQDKLLPDFVKGESGEHRPMLLKKETKAPAQFTEASLLRSMETAGKDVDDEELRDLMKKNGIGRPSTRSNIIETLFKREYIKRNKKQILPTPIGISLIDLIDNELLKSAELTGNWEKKLTEIEAGTYKPGAFVKEMKKMVDALVYEVRSDSSYKKIQSDTKLEKVLKPGKRKSKKLVGTTCPKCRQGKLLKGSKAYGCSQFTKGCHLVLPFRFNSKKVSDTQYLRLIEKGSSALLKGFVVDGDKVQGRLKFNAAFELELEIDQDSEKYQNICPKCKKGKLVKGKKAYGCSNYNKGCDFIIEFDRIRQEAGPRTLTKELVIQIIQNS